MRQIDNSLDQFAIRMRKDNSVNLDIAKQQHRALADALSSCGVSVRTLPSDGYPDSVFIEDTAVVINSIALITNPGAESRKGEVHRVKEYLSKRLYLNVKTLSRASAILDGGDVLFTGEDRALVFFISDMPYF